MSRSNSGSGVDDTGISLRARWRPDRRHLGAVALHRGDVERLTESGDLVDLGKLGGEFVAVALGHAAGDDQLRAVAALLVEREDRVDRLAARLVDERTGVDDDEVGERQRRRSRSMPSASSAPTSLSESTSFFGQPSVSM